MTFLNPIYLLGTALVAVPVIIHLWFRRRMKKIAFSSLVFLKATEARRLGWLKLRDILVLACRCLFILFLFGGLARPQLTSPLFTRARAFSNRLASVVMVIDNSFSMRYGRNFERALEAARAIIGCYSPSSEFCVLPLVGADWPRSWTGRSAALKQADATALTFGSGSLPPLIEGAASLRPSFERDYIYIGDGQETVFMGLDKQALPGRGLMWHRIPGGDNLSVSRVFMPDPVSIAVDRYRITAVVSDHSGRPFTGTVRFASRDLELSADLRAEPGQEAEVVFEVPVECGAGIVSVLADDSLTGDNDYFFSKTVPRKTRVLAIGAGGFLKDALNPSDGPAGPFEITGSSNLRGNDLRKYAILILDGVPDLSADEEIRIRDFLARNDTGMLIFLGDDAGPGLRRLIAPLAAVQGIAVPRGYLTLDWVDYDHPVFSVFKNTSSLKGVRFYRFHELKARSRTIAKVDQYPLVVCDGNLSLVACRPDPSNTDLVYRAAFVPFLHRLAGGVIYRLPDREYQVGMPVDSTRVLQGIGGEYRHERVFSVPGLFRYGGDTVGVNVDPAESRLRSMDEGSAAQLGVWVLGSLKALGGIDLAPLLLLLALGVFVAELVLLVLR